MELTPLSAGIAGAIAMFALQLLLCFKVRRIAAKLIPVYLVVAALLYAGATFLGVFGTYSAGAISGNELAGLVLLLVAGIAATGSALAWLVFGLSKLIGGSGRHVGLDHSFCIEGSFMLGGKGSRSDLLQRLHTRRRCPQGFWEMMLPREAPANQESEG